MFRSFKLTNSTCLGKYLHVGEYSHSRAKMYRTHEVILMICDGLNLKGLQDNYPRLIAKDQGEMLTGG